MVLVAALGQLDLKLQHAGFFFFFLVEALICGMWKLVPLAGIEPGPLTLVAQSHSCGATTEFPGYTYSKIHGLGGNSVQTESDLACWPACEHCFITDTMYLASAKS